MLSCWYCNPEKRPKFSNLERKLLKILGKSKSDHYIDLNKPYLEANETRFNSGETDFLALLNSPECSATQTPINELHNREFEPLAKVPRSNFIATEYEKINELYWICKRDGKHVKNFAQKGNKYRSKQE